MKSLEPAVALLAIHSPSLDFCPVTCLKKLWGSFHERQSPDIPHPALVTSDSPALVARLLLWSPSLEPAQQQWIAAAGDRADDPFQGLALCHTMKGCLWILLAQDRGGAQFGRRKHAWYSTCTSTSGTEQRVPGQPLFLVQILLANIFTVG